MFGMRCLDGSTMMRTMRTVRKMGAVRIRGLNPLKCWLRRVFWGLSSGLYVISKNRPKSTKEQERRNTVIHSSNNGQKTCQISLLAADSGVY